jgi:hypothetical protein
MSDKKTIDVRDGDEWTVDSDGHLWQYRDGYCRCAIRTGCDAEIDAPPIKNDDENPILYEAAIATLTAWGYTITPAKPEQVITKRYGPVETVMVTAAEQPAIVEFPLEGGKTTTVEYPSEYHARKAAAVGHGRVVKPDATTDVPVVDAVWVELNFGNKRRALYAYSDEASAVHHNGAEFANGTARIVRLAADPTLAATVKWLEDRVATLEAATTPAKVRVVAPDFAPSRVFSVVEQTMIHELNGKWRAALAAAGVEVKEASNGKA